MIFGNETDFVFFTCLSDKKVYLSQYSTFDKDTSWYSIAAYDLVTPVVNVVSDVSFAVFTNTGHYFGFFVSSVSFQ